MKTVIWLEDNPDTINLDVFDIQDEFEGTLDIQIWNGNYKGSSKGLVCIEHFKNKIDEAIQKDINIVAFILDIRIPLPDLSVLGLNHIRNEDGLITGANVARYYLRNEDNTSPLGDRFKGIPILFFTVAGGTVKEHPWMNDEQQKYRFIEKTTPKNFDAVTKWLKQFC